MKQQIHGRLDQIHGALKTTKANASQMYLSAVRAGQDVNKGYYELLDKISRLETEQRLLEGML